MTNIPALIKANGARWAACTIPAGFIPALDSTAKPTTPQGWPLANIMDLPGTTSATSYNFSGVSTSPAIVLQEIVS